MFMSPVSIELLLFSLLRFLRFVMIFVFSRCMSCMSIRTCCWISIILRVAEVLLRLT